MTYKQIQDRVMSRRGNLTSTDARTRVKEFINERYRRVRSSIGLGSTRWSTTTKALVAGTNEYVISSVAKIGTIYDPTNKKTLREIPMASIRLMDPGLQQTSASPDFYAIESVGATSVTVFIWPTPTATQTLNLDVLALVTDLAADADVPAFPEDFHDILIFGTLADEYQHAEKVQLELKEELKFERRLSALRYYIAKSKWMAHRQGQLGMQISRLGPNYEANY
jgi:hypothetical protein